MKPKCMSRSDHLLTEADKSRDTHKSKTLACMSTTQQTDSLPTPHANSLFILNPSDPMPGKELSSRLNIALPLEALQPKGRRYILKIQVYLPCQALLSLQESQRSVTI